MPHTKPEATRNASAACGRLEPLVRRFELLRNATERAICEAQEIRNEFDDAVNWADLRCTRIFYWTDDSGDCGFTLEIEEVDPSSWTFGRWVAEAVEKETGITVEVNCEW